MSVPPLTSGVAVRAFDAGVRTGSIAAGDEPTEDRLRRALDEARPRSLTEVDMATISEAARNLRAAERETRDRDADPTEPPGEPDLSESQERAVRELEARDREVRAHEQAHLAAAGDIAVGGPSYTYQTGPDGKRYAIGGAVDVKLEKGSTPEETLRNMERAQRAANAPDSPSGPDRAAAARAARIAAEARAEQREGEPGSLVDRTA